MIQTTTPADTRQPKGTTTPVQGEDRFITDREVSHLIGSSRSWPWKLAREGKMPAPIQISSRCTRWRLSEVRAFMADPRGWAASHKEV